MPTREILSGHRHFTDRLGTDNAVLRKLAEEGQSPKVLWIGCSDSRVVPELITGADPGELFMVRNIANIVPPATTTAAATGAAIEYAVRHLGVQHAVVCGHSECGGIQALECSVWPEEEAHIAAWVEWARPARAQVLEAGVPAGERCLATVKANVLLQCENLRSYACVAHAEAAGELAVHAWLYDLHTGALLGFDPGVQTWARVTEPA